jgi:hypothetical protein
VNGRGIRRKVGPRERQIAFCMVYLWHGKTPWGVVLGTLWGFRVNSVGKGRAEPWLNIIITGA